MPSSWALWITRLKVSSGIEIAVFTQSWYNPVIPSSRTIRPACPHRPAEAEPSLAGTNNQQAAHVNAVGIERFQRGDSQILTVTADLPAYDYRCVRRPEPEQELTSSSDLLPPRTGGWVVNGD